MERQRGAQTCTDARTKTATEERWGGGFELGGEGREGVMEARKRGKALRGKRGKLEKERDREEAKKAGGVGMLGLM